MLVDTDGTIVRKGQPLFKVKPGVELTGSDAEEEARARREHTVQLVAAL